VSTERWLKTDWRSGLKFLSIGLFGKVFFADILNLFHKNIFAIDFMADATPLDALYLCLAYSFQIYYDFWAYSLMAIGLGKLLAIDLPVNFREPYLSPNPREFWRRWHITLSYWLRDYVYIKMGGNRSYVRNIVILFALVGLWHGAGWNFVVWGLYHALLVVGYHGLRRWWDRMPQALQVGTTFALVTFGWPLFFADLGEYRLILEKMIGLQGSGVGIYGLRHWLVLAAIAAWTFSMREARWLYNDRPRAVFDWPVAHASALFLGAVFVYFSGTFIYFRF
jgi:alginate O-acetyltransferase complex protein AlgI